MAKKEENIYPDGYPRQTESFSEAQKFKFDVFEAIKDISVKATKKAFEDKGYAEKDGRAGEYGTGENYGSGTDNNHFNIRLSSRPNTNTYFEKIIYFGGKKTITEVSIGWDANNKAIELTYKTSEVGSFRGYNSKAGAHLINDRSNFVIDSISSFKKELEKIFKSYAEKEVAHITSTKIGIEDKTEKSINSMVEHMKKNKLTLSDIFSSSLEDVSNNVESYVNEARKDGKEKKDKSKDQDKEKLRMNNPEVVAANSKGKLLFDDLSELEEGEYKEYFKDRMKKFGAKNPKELKPSEWAEINHGWKSKEEKKLAEISTAGSASVGAIGGQVVSGELGTVGNFKYAANPFKMDTGIMKRNFQDTNYAKGKKKRASVEKKFEEGDTFWSKVELNDGSGYVPKGMEKNYVQGQHDLSAKGPKKKSKKLNESILNETGEWVWDEDQSAWAKGLEDDVKIIENAVPGFELIEVKGFDNYQGPYARVIINGKNYNIWTVGQDLLWIENFSVDNTSGDDKNPGFEGTVGDIIDMLNSNIKESLIKRKFTTINENNDKGINKRYIVTEKRTEKEESNRWKKLSLFETYESIHKAENLCECSGECSCTCHDDDDKVTMDQGQNETEREFMQRNQDAEIGEFVDGKEVIIISKPDSISNAEFKVFKDDYLNENKAYILDMKSGNLVCNPNFKAKKQ